MYQIKGQLLNVHGHVTFLGYYEDILKANSAIWKIMKEGGVITDKVDANISIGTYVIVSPYIIKYLYIVQEG